MATNFHTSEVSTTTKNADRGSDLLNHDKDDEGSYNKKTPRATGLGRQKALRLLKLVGAGKLLRSRIHCIRFHQGLVRAVLCAVLRNSDLDEQTDVVFEC